MKALTEGLFEKFFTAQDEKLQFAVDDLFENIFKEAFDVGGDKLNQQGFEDIIEEKLEDDADLQNILNDAFKQLELDAEGYATSQQVKNVLASTLKDQMNQLLEEKEETSWKVEEMRQTAGGAYARQMIQRIIQGFKDRNIMEGEGNPY